jgi:hypothetical protein
MVAAGAITRQDAVAALTAAGLAASQSPRQVRDAISGGFADEGVVPAAAEHIGRLIYPHVTAAAPGAAA